MLLGQFQNDRDAYQCYHRVGRFGEAAKRCAIAGVPLVSGDNKARYISRLATAIKELKELNKKKPAKASAAIKKAEEEKEK